MTKRKLYNSAFILLLIGILKSFVYAEVVFEDLVSETSQSQSQEPVSISGEELTMNVTQGELKKVPVALLSFNGPLDQIHNLTKVVTNDLNHSHLFTFIPHDSFLQSSIDDGHPRWEDWKIINARYLIDGNVRVIGDHIEIQYRVWDVNNQLLKCDTILKVLHKKWRRLGHIVANGVYKAITESEGYFDSRIAYIAEEGPQNKRIKRLAIMDYDGENHHYLTSSKKSVIMPHMSPDGKKIVYMAYENKKCSLFIWDLEKGKAQVVSGLKGDAYSPRFSPDGKSIIFTLAHKGYSCLYSLDLSHPGRSPRKLTSDLGIDTSPAYSYDGKKIIFNSDRSGKKHLYIMNADGSNCVRISGLKGSGGTYATPVWSPSGEWIAFTKIQYGKFYIGIMRPNGNDEKLLATEFLVESPTWAPDGRTILYYEQGPWKKDGSGGKSRLKIIDISGQLKRTLETTTPVIDKEHPYPHIKEPLKNATDPSWSLNLPLGK